MNVSGIKEGEERMQGVTFDDALAGLARALMDKSTLLNSLCDCAPCLMWAKDMHGTYVYANARHRKEFLGIGETAPLDGVTDGGHSLAEICSISDEAVLRHDKPLRFLERGVNKDGSDLFLQVHKAPWRDSMGTLQGTAGVAVDVTARLNAQKKILEAFDRKIKALGLEHEFETEMTMLRAYADRHKITETKDGNH